jgi:AAA domain, putative AbiEii toxin, Type IV TA system
MSEENNNLEANTKRVSIKNLYLDPNNYRLIHETEQIEVADEQVKDKTVAQRTFRLLAGEKNQHIRDLIESYKSNGYLPVDQIQVRELPSGGYLVVEGNRRVATLKFLALEYEQKAVDLGRLDPSIFSRVPVVLYSDADEMHHLTLMALKHISGNRKWGEWNQAKLLEKMHNTFHLEEDEICRRIGISKVELRRSLRALSLVEQYQSSDYGDQFNESKFPIFREAVKNLALKEWIDWDDATFKAKNQQNYEQFFSWLSREPVEEADDEGQAGYGDKYLEPAIVKRDDVTLLGKILKDNRSLQQLKISRDLNSAYRASDLVFQERQESAVKSVAMDISTLSQLAIRGEHLPDLESALGRLQGIVDRTRGSGLSGVEQKSVFHDRIDKHFSSIEVKNYKKLQGLNLHKLSKINLFAGLNNSGKTTLLEAIYLLTRQNDFAGILEVIRRRGKVPEDHINPEWLIEQLSGEINIGGTFDRQHATVSIRDYLENDVTLDKSRYLKTVEIVSEFGSAKQESLTRIFKGRDRETTADSIKLLSQVIYSSPFFLNEPHRYASFYHKSVQSKALPQIFEFIQQAIIPTITDIRLVDELQRFLVIDSLYPTALDLMCYGEGLQRIFFISLLFASAQNGVILIDEFENAIHTDLIAKFAPFIHTLANIFNVQVFLTSHSKECIDAFVQNVPLSQVDYFSFHALVENEAGNIEAREFGGKEYATLLRVADVDLRKAQ